MSIELFGRTTFSAAMAVLLNLIFVALLTCSIPKDWKLLLARYSTVDTVHLGILTCKTQTDYSYFPGSVFYVKRNASNYRHQFLQ